MANNSSVYSHPIFRPRQMPITTPAMTLVRDELTRCVWTHQTGVIITGQSRAGKTSACRQIKRCPILNRDGASVPVLYVSIRHRDKPTIKSVFRQLCLSSDLKISDRDNSDTLCRLYFHHILDRIHSSPSPNVLLLVDEFQRLSPDQFDAFAELYDVSEEGDIDLTTAFIGNDPECRGLIEKLESDEFAHIYGRFFGHWIAFTGLVSEQQVASCLRQYDTLRYPDDGPSYTGFFLPQAVKEGWRFESLAPDLWRIFSEYRSAARITSWGMQSFTSTINTLLSDVLPHCGVENHSDEHIHECIRISGLLPGLVKPKD